MTQSKHQNLSGVSAEEAQAMREQGMPEWEVRLTHFERKFQREKATQPPKPGKAVPCNFLEAAILEGFPDLSRGEELDVIAQVT